MTAPARDTTPDRRAPRYLRGLDPVADHERIYRHMVMREFWPEARVGLNLAFYRTYAVPSIARLLLATGELTGRPVKRAYDTGAIMYELIAHGIDHPRGQRVLTMLNRMHRVHGISDPEYRYVLGTLVFVPGRWIDRFGPRPLTRTEHEATFQFYRRVGAAMHIPDIPPTLAAFEAEFDEFERVNFGFDPAASTLILATKDLMAQRLPAALRNVGWARRAMAAATDTMLDPPVRTALGVPEPSRAVEMAVHGLLRLRGRLRRFATIPDRDLWTPGQPNAAYPDGYTLDQLGPDRPAPDRADR
ncbi:oxygenase MpaB family protein [Micromonospora sp. NPDC050417]|uniref:oxygenase MpaB family protein n=1 Tax=Micromonospora sp. NPDC050417 TaxID=3364280 RepID=UPI00378A69F5